MSTKKIFVRVKEGTELGASLPAGLMNTNFKVEPLFDIGDEVKKILNNNFELLNKKEDQEKFFFQNIYNQKSEEEKRLFRTFKLTFDNEEEADAMLKKLSEDGNIDFVEEDHRNVLYFNNDPRTSELYALKKLQCSQAWGITQGENIIVAVIDSGVDYEHPDIKGNMWQDVSGNFGRNFTNNSDNPMDDVGHGTHVAGTIAATGNNGIGIIGVAPKVKIMALKAFTAEGGLNEAIKDAIKYAVDNGAHVINNSWGPGGRLERNQLVESMIDYAISKGIVVVFAAGNNNDNIRHYAPANHPGVISVAATDENDAKADYSNYGDLVTVAAPGSNILSLEMQTSDYFYDNGTSMAAPHVSAICALMLSRTPALTPQQIRTKLASSADPVTGEHPPIGAGRVNAFKAL
jgi:thermitase